MKTKIAYFLIFVFAFILTISPVLAVNPNGSSAYNGLEKGNSSVMHLYMYEKDASWNVVDGGAWGKMTFNKNKNLLVFNGYGLDANREYSVIHYMGDNPNLSRDKLHMIAIGTSTSGGEVNIKGSWDVWKGKFWLVPASDLNGVAGDKVLDNLTNWNPGDYLFEYNDLSSIGLV